MNALTSLPFYIRYAATIAATATSFSMSLAGDGGEKIMFPGTGSWGVNIHTPYHEEAMKALNAQWVRIGMRWEHIEAGARGEYNWDEADRLVDFYASRGYHMLLCMTAENRSPAFADEADEEKVITGIADWLGAAAARYAGKGIVWEIGNEPEVFPMGGFWSNPETYTKMARLAAKKMKAADPTCKVAALSVAWMDRGFITKSLEAGLLDDRTIEIISFHGYHRGALAAENKLAEDVTWLREMVAKHKKPGAHVIVIDSERGYAIIPREDAKVADRWTNELYSETEQAAYLARHYLEEISLGIEISIWYKDLFGETCFSLYYSDEKNPDGMRPMGVVYRNLAALLPLNPKEMVNSAYPVSLEAQSASDKSNSKDQSPTFVRSYLVKHDGKTQLVVAAWRSIEAFDGKILVSRDNKDGKVTEEWRPITPDDKVEIPATIAVKGVNSSSIKTVKEVRLTERELSSVNKTAKYEKASGDVIKLPLKIGPVPSVFVINLTDK